MTYDKKEAQSLVHWTSEYVTARSVFSKTYVANLVNHLITAIAHIEKLENCFICIDCGRRKADEDGICASCGRQCLRIIDGRVTNIVPSPVDEIAADRDRLAAEVLELKAEVDRLMGIGYAMMNPETVGEIMADNKRLTAENERLAAEVQRLTDIIAKQLPHGKHPGDADSWAAAMWNLKRLTAENVELGKVVEQSRMQVAMMLPVVTAAEGIWAREDLEPFKQEDTKLTPGERELSIAVVVYRAAIDALAGKGDGNGE